MEMDKPYSYDRAKLFPHVDKLYTPEAEDQKVIDVYKAKEQKLIKKINLSPARQKIDDAMMALVQKDKHVHNTLLFHAMTDDTLVEGHPLDHEGKVQEALDGLFNSLLEENDEEKNEVE